MDNRTEIIMENVLDKQNLTVPNVLGALALAYTPLYYKLSPASVSTKIWTTIYGSIIALRLYSPDTFYGVIASIRDAFTQTPLKAALITLGVAVPLK